MVSHIEDIKLNSVHRRKAAVRHTMYSKITSLNFFENINTSPLKQIKVKMGCTIPIIISRELLHHKSSVINLYWDNQPRVKPQDNRFSVKKFNKTKPVNIKYG